MADREKVKTGLELCQQGFDCPSDCPYLMDCNDLMKPMFIELAKDALELLQEQEDLGTELTNAVELIHKKNERIEKLLKEQETVKPKKIKGFNQPCYVHYAFICENCKTDLIQGQPYCAGCGRKVKWE